MGRYGPVTCMVCLDKQARLKRPGQHIEFTSESIKEQRKEYADDLEPPHIKNELNKKWLDIWGKEQAIKHGFTENEIKSAKYLNNGYYKE